MTIAIMVLVKATMVLPGQYYFSFSGFLFAGDVISQELYLSPDDPRTQWMGEGAMDRDAVLAVSWIGLVIKLAIPFLVGFVAALIWTEEDTLPSARLAGVLAAFVLVWPALMYWDIVVPHSLHDKENVFLLLYLTYWLAYGALCGAGVAVSRFVRRNSEVEIDLMNVGLNAFAGLGFTAACSGLAYAFGGQ